MAVDAIDKLWVLLSEVHLKTCVVESKGEVEYTELTLLTILISDPRREKLFVLLFFSFYFEGISESEQVINQGKDVKLLVCRKGK